MRNGNDRQEVEQNGAEQHPKHGADEEAPSKLLIADQEQRNVDGGEIRADAAEDRFFTNRANMDMADRVISIVVTVLVAACVCALLARVLFV